MGWNFWDDYNERNEDCVCCPDSPNYQGKLDRVLNEQVRIPVNCEVCEKPLADQTKSHKRCDACYLQSQPSVIVA